MALKSVLANLDGVPDSLRGEYKEHEGKFYLDIEGIDDHHAVGALRRAKDYEKEEARKAKAAIATIQQSLDTTTTELETLRKTGVPKDKVEALENSYKDKMTKREKELTDKITALTTSLETHLIDGSAIKLANEIAAKPEYVEVLLPHVRKRLVMEAGEGEQQVVRVLDKDGKASATTLEELKKELLGNKAFAALLVGSKANGGGSGGGSGGGGGAVKKLSEMNEAERTAFAKDNPEGFRAALAESQKAAQSKY